MQVQGEKKKKKKRGHRGWIMSSTGLAAINWPTKKKEEQQWLYDAVNLQPLAFPEGEKRGG